ncbi:MAG: DUF2129 domain-containing protein [Bacilli bacterium]|nr:DUF2129 domain-containing protein [Bacilli bacterium]
MRVSRQGLVVWYKHKKNLRQIRRYGHLIYASRRLKFALIYVNRDEIEEIEKKLNKLPFVKKTERSYRPFLSTNFENVKMDEAKLYDYK